MSRSQEKIFPKGDNVVDVEEDMGGRMMRTKET